MNLIEFIGFLISLAFLFFLFFQRKWEMYQRRKYPERYEEQRRKKDEDLKTLLASMGLEVQKDDEDEEEEEDYLEEEEEEEPRPLPVPQRPVTPPPSPIRHPQRIVNDAYTIKTNVEQRHMVPAVERRTLGSRLNASYKGYTGADVVSSEMRSMSDAYAIRKESGESRGTVLMRKLSSKQEMVLYREIFDQPRSLRGWDR